MFLPGEPNEPSITERTVPEQANKVTHLEFALLINLPSSLYISVQYIYIYVYVVYFLLSNDWNTMPSHDTN